MVDCFKVGKSGVLEDQLAAVVIQMRDERDDVLSYSRQNLMLSSAR